jgi:hypothetical protein
MRLCGPGVSLLLLLNLMAPVAAGAQTEKIHALLAKPKILCGRFDQTKQLAGLKKPLLSSGRFCVVADKGILWRNLRPFASTVRLTRDEIVQMQGDRVTSRLSAKEEPTVRLMNSVLFSMLAGDFSQLEKLFTVDSSVHNDHWRATLKAREPALAKTLDTIAMDGGVFVSSIAIHELNGDQTRIVFSEIQTGDRAMNDDEAALF